MRRDTELQHRGEDREAWSGAAVPPVVRTSLFTFPDTASLEAWYRGDRSRWLYSREANPTVRVLEEKVAGLEGTGDARAFASGMGAVSAVLLAHLSAGDHLVLFGRSYGPTLTFARDVLARMGVAVSHLEPGEETRLGAVIRAETRLVWLESPASLTFEMLDLATAAEAARERGVPTACDNSWASPVLQNPARLGVDLVVHSATKYIAGHSDVVAGMVAGSGEPFARVRAVAPLLGACLAPDDAALTLRGLRTLPLRIERQGRSALLLAERLAAQPRVARVSCPALPSFPGHALWRRQCRGASGLFSFVVDGDARAFCDALEVFSLGVSWGGHESLALPVIATRPADRSRDPRPDLDDGLVRLSVGLEDPEDLWEDLERGLEAAGPGGGRAR